ncbi:MAG: spore coat associated protein CotJA [Firmicutes bacterium]|nr:spore coat associated protein CotJA [Bacillota bacterium]
MATSCQDVLMPCDECSMKAAYAFVPVQNVNRFYDYLSAMQAGTIFPDLHIPKGKYGPKENFSE